MARGWYVLHALSGYEAKVEYALKKLIEDDAELAESVFDVKIPQEEVMEIRNGKKRTVNRKFLPGYMLVEMDLSDLTWKSVVSKIRRINGVMGFLGTTVRGQKPNAITPDEARSVLQKTGDIKADKSVRLKQDFSVDEQVKIIAGPFDTFTGKITEVNQEKGRLRVSVGIFGRSTPVEVDFTQVEKI
ncbi:MAG: transcription termination/antitermination protein NusG [Spirochaetia bacterium]|nr:transcription termination/antitermination protein NusG [Spirochaetia bacterium]